MREGGEPLWRLERASLQGEGRGCDSPLVCVMLRGGIGSALPCGVNLLRNGCSIAAAHLSS